MGSGIFNIGMSGLSAAQMGVTTTSHNIANASTPGYTRQTVLQTTPTPLLTGGGFVGQGTSVTTVQRIYNQYPHRPDSVVPDGCVVHEHLFDADSATGQSAGRS